MKNIFFSIPLRVLLWLLGIISTLNAMVGIGFFDIRGTHFEVLFHVGFLFVAILLICLALAQEKKIRYYAYHDPVTGLPNRSLFKNCLAVALAQAQRKGQMMAILFLDLDQFKSINDRHGHAFGDLVLKEAAERLKTCLRIGDTVSRLGGDEFAIMLQDITREDAVQVAQRILYQFSHPFILNAHNIFVTPSIGISLYPHDGTEIESLIKKANMAMYRVKVKGKNDYRSIFPRFVCKGNRKEYGDYLTLETIRTNY